MNKAVFLDRDGIINKSPKKGSYITEISQIDIIHPIFEITKYMRSRGYLVIVITNQRCVDLGILSEGKLNEINTHIMDEALRLGTKIDDLYYCPHLDDQCNCRKPLPGMVLEAVKKHNIDKKKSIIIGDTWRDVDLGTEQGLITCCVGINCPETINHFNDLNDLLCYLKLNY
jgi:D-glycero-D-manno-heptose 1,7-bisphosphate phosphatase